MELTVGRIVHVKVLDSCIAGIVNCVEPLGITLFPVHGPMLEAARRDHPALDMVHDPRTCPQPGLSITIES